MHTRHWQHKLLLLKSNRPKEQGFILALVVIVGLILAAGAMAMMARSTSGLLGSIRQQQSREAREIAEAGTNRVVERLNREYAYLLINCYDRDLNTADWYNCKNKDGIGSWEAPKYPTATCPGASLNAAAMVKDGDVNNAADSRAGRWQLEFYHFKGSKLYGGQGVMRVRGQRLSADGTLLAEAYVDQELSIKPKNCDAAFNQPPTTTGFPGLMGNTITLGNNDVLGEISGNILCIGCESDAEVTQGPNSVVNGNIFASNVSLPDVPRHPTGLSPDNPITAPGTYASGNNHGGKCLIDNSKRPPITHCMLGNIDLKGSQELVFDTTNGPMQLYLQCKPAASGWCQGPNINLGGQGGIRHCTNGNCSSTTIDPTALALFGNPDAAIPVGETPACGYDSKGGSLGRQSVKLGGGSQATVMFAYLPDACGGINGGSSDPDILGALWLKSFGPIGSSSNRAEIRVPDDMGARVFTRFGTGFAISIRDFVAIGINNWGSFQMPPTRTQQLQ